MEALLSSKKGFAALLACLFAAYGVNKGWSLDQLLLVTAPLATYIGVQGAVDHRLAKSPKSPEGPE